MFIMTEFFPSLDGDDESTCGKWDVDVDENRLFEYTQFDLATGTLYLFSFRLFLRFVIPTGDERSF